MSMTVEEAFLRDILANHNDPAPLLIYADWLDEQGTLGDSAKSAFVRLSAALCSAPDAKTRAALRKQLRQARKRLEDGWVAALTRAPLENCPVRFRNECPKRWELLTLTDEPAQRYCHACEQTVYYCRTVAEARDHVRAGHCVCVDQARTRRKGDLRRRPGRVRRMGRMLPPH